MEDLDHKRLHETLASLLRDGRGLQADGDGWVAIDRLRTAASDHLQVDVSRVLVEQVGQRGRFEVRGSSIRMQRKRRSGRGPSIPDILFHATTVEGMARVRAEGVLSGGRRRLTLSDDEVQAWRAAHRMRGAPTVLVVDTLRARRSGVRFYRNRHNGLFSASDVPARHLLNLRPGYDVQLSAGGIPMRARPDGSLEMALIQVTRRSGVTWEVAKGKLEPGETPMQAAVREVQEEMGVTVDFDVLRYVAPVRYGFLAPGGAPRLKTIDLYLMEPKGDPGSFHPSHREGIGEVAWFGIDDAVAAVTHSSLRPVMRRARELANQHGLSPDPELTR